MHFRKAPALASLSNRQWMAWLGDCRTGGPRCRQLALEKPCLLSWDALHRSRRHGKLGSRNMKELPEGLYPFIDERFRLADMAMVEAPSDLEAMFKRQAVLNGIELIRDEPVELRCQSEDYPDATFLVYWPLGKERIHMLVPKRFATGRA
jgi:hypothetical protein